MTFWPAFTTWPASSIDGGDDAVEVGRQPGVGELRPARACSEVRARIRLALAVSRACTTAVELRLRRDVALDSGRWRASSAVALASCASALATAASALRTSWTCTAGSSGGELVALLDDGADVDGARHHAAEQAEAVVGRVARLDAAGEGPERLLCADLGLDRQHRPYGRRLPPPRACSRRARAGATRTSARLMAWPPRSRPSGRAAASGRRRRRPSGPSSRPVTAIGVLVEPLDRDRLQRHGLGIAVDDPDRGLAVLLEQRAPGQQHDLARLGRAPCR